MFSAFLISILSFVQVDVLDNKPIYQNPLAFVRSPESSIFLKTSTYRGARLKYLEAEIGRTIPIVRLRNRNGVFDFDLQLGIEAASWSILGYSEGSFPLITQDFLLAVPLMFKVSSVSGALKFNHISSHVGDGMDLLWDKSLTKEQKEKIETIENQGNVSISPPVKNYSRDFWSIEIAQTHDMGFATLKSYVHTGHVHKMIPKHLKRWFVGQGFELRHSSGLFLADDVRYNQDTDTLDFSAQGGWMFEGYFAEMRMCVTGYHGSNRRGQFAGQKINEFGLGMFFR